MVQETTEASDDGEEHPEGRSTHVLKNQLDFALKRAEQAESERAEVSQLLAARERDIEKLKQRLAINKATVLSPSKTKYQHYPKINPPPIPDT